MKKFLSLFAAILFAGSMFAAVGNLYYTATFLKGTAETGSVSGYDKTGTYTAGDMKWTIPGNNTNGDYIRVGGKSLVSVERVISSQSGMGDAIAKIVIAHNGKSRDKIVVDSVILTVASNAEFTANVEQKIVRDPEVKKSTAGTIEFLATESWATGSFYKFSFFITNPDNSNGGLDVQSIAFYSYLSPSAPSITAEKVNFGLVVTTTLPIVKNADLVVTSANLSDAISYEVSGSHVEATGTLTADGGTLAVTLTADAEEEISDTIVLTSGAIVTKVAVEANVIKTVGDGTKDNPFIVADVVKINNGLGNDEFWVKGYIVGCAANGGVISTGDDVASNIAIGDAADQTAGVVPVELPSGDIREAVNIKDNTGNKGKLIKVHGQLTSYFLFTGVKGIDDYEFDSSTAIDNTEAEVKAEKFFRNGQLIIRKNGVEYNALGTQL